ncbi:MAG: ATP-binding cassette domain-containing protein [Gemmatimonadetes bacterium]|nr:ATP-binding cassette domain-containing protein [Gemmatimonadota bacterium]NIO32955.1 ATP-binding cassette domain-containing protein [Gemmatimonadota bacterium]
MQAFLELDHLTRTFAGTPAVHELSLSVGEHEIVTLLGPSGCGKTTTLRMIAGFETPNWGRIVLDGRDVTRLPPQKRGFGMVFQHYALFPHMSVGANVAFGLETAGLTRMEIDERVARALKLVRLPGAGGRSIGSLSGGQQQRVALARALAPQPKVLLLDEPLSNLDASLREQTRRELRTLVKEIGITTVYVTHDQEEAFDLSDRIAVMREGRLEQLGPAEDLYHGPASEFVATFLGRAGAVTGRVETIDRDGIVTFRLAGDVMWRALTPATGGSLQPGAEVRLLARPEALAFAGPVTEAALRGEVKDRRFAGSIYVYTVAVEGGELEVQAGADQARLGDVVAVVPRSAPTGLFVFTVRSEGQDP